MVAPPTKPVPEDQVEEIEEGDDYESDEFDVEEDEGDEYQDDDGDEEEDDEAPQENGKNLTALLLADNNGQGDLDDEEDEGYTPDGQPDPAEQPVDGAARELAPEAGGNEPEEAKTTVLPVAAPGLKRKTSGDDEDEEEAEGETEAKKVKT